LRAYIGAPGGRQAIHKNPDYSVNQRKLQQFHQGEPILQSPCRLHSRREDRLPSTGRFSMPEIPPVSISTDGAIAPDQRETTMLHKLSLAALAAISLGAAALAPTSASAWGWHPGWHSGWHHGWWGPRLYAGGPSLGYGGCYVRELVPTPWGPRWRRVNRCY